MTRSTVALVRLASPLPPPTSDAELLRSFVAARGEDAFTELVRRHGPMVLAVCRRVLSDTHDAEDAFQAVFLVLARKASTVRSTNLAGWLYGVAVRTARGVRVMRNRRQKHAVRQEMASRKQKSGISDDELTPDSSLLLAEQAAIIDEELAKLPEQYRDAIVTCELRGLSRKEAAAELRIPEGTLSSRLAAAKRKLSVRLAARGLASTVMLGAAIGPATVSAALEQSTALAVRGVASSVAHAVASTVIKGMLFDQLKAVVLAAGLLLTGVCGGLAMTGSPDAPSKGNAPASPSAEDPATKLVKQLGNEDFTTRQAAAKELRKLGAKAESALRAGLKSEDPEIRLRCTKILAEVRKDRLDALVKDFDPKAKVIPDYPIWKRFKAIAGDTPASRDIFARIIENRRWLQRLDDAEISPASAAKAYREECIAIGRWATDPRIRDPYPHWARIEGAAFLLFLGSYPGTTYALTEDANNDKLYSAGEIEFGAGPSGIDSGLRAEQPQYVESKEFPPPPKLKPAVPGTDRVFGKLLTAWLPLRTNPDVLLNGFQYASMFAEGCNGLLPFAREVVANKAMTALVRSQALFLIAAGGTPADLPLFEAMFENETILQEWTPRPEPGFRPKRASIAQVRDVALGLALILFGQYPEDFGFVNAEDPWRHQTKKPVISHYAVVLFGFPDEKTRLAAYEKTKAFIAKQKEKPKKEEPKPALAPEKLVEQLGSEDFAEREAAQKQLKELGSKARAALEAGLKSQNPEIVKRCGELLDHLTRVEFDARHWPRFAKVIGDDKASRTLFERIRSHRRNVELLDAVAADPKAASKLYHDRWTELNKAARIELGPGSYTFASASLAEVVGWMYLGTFPGTEGGFHTSYPLEFLPFFPLQKNSRDGLFDTLTDKDLAPPLRRLIGKWTAARIDYSGRVYGFELALQFDIKEVLPAARDTLTNVVKDDPYPGNTTRNMGFAMLVIGKLGSKDDLPLLEKFATSKDVCAVCLNDPPPKPGEPVIRLYRLPIEGQDTTGQLRDVSAAMRLHLLGQDPDQYGFYWQHPNVTDRKPVKPGERFSLYSIGFIRDADRTAAHKKAKEWFDKQKK